MRGGEPIAVVGIACRVPGASSPAAFWRLLQEGVDAISEISEERRVLAGGSAIWGQAFEEESIARRGGFLEDIDLFDAAFFGVSPREAAAMDPQQRLMLELCWEALEDAGVAPDRLRGSHASVFVGSIASDYADVVREQGSRALTRHALTGLHRSLIANRVSYVLGLRGPSMTLDTGQSSSLVAVHLACEGLRRRRVTGRACLWRASEHLAEQRARGRQLWRPFPGWALLHFRYAGQRLCSRRGWRGGRSQASV